MRKRIYELLKRLEWVNSNCPECGSMFRTWKHEEGCELRALLDEAEQDPPAPSEPQPEGGDADDDAAGPVPTTDDSPHVALGAGAESEQDAPTPSEDSEGEVEPVGLAPAEVAAMGWDYKSFIVYRDDPGFRTTPLYSHETVERLQQVRKSLRGVVRAFRADRNRLWGRMRVLRRELADAKAEIARLRDPENWRIVGPADIVFDLPPSVDRLNVRYVGPPDASPLGTDAEWALDLIAEKVQEAPNTSGSVLALTIGYERVQRLLRGLEEARAQLAPQQDAGSDAYVSDGVARIARERRRQIGVEGWTPGHDDEHDCGELAKVAAVLAVEGTDATVAPGPSDPDDTSLDDPWGLVSKHRSDRMRMLTIAGALIAAEIDRLLRVGPSESEGESGHE